MLLCKKMQTAGIRKTSDRLSTCNTLNTKSNTRFFFTKKRNRPNLHHKKILVELDKQI